MIETYAALPNNFEGILKACVSYYRKSKDEPSKERIRARRAGFARFAKIFHLECGTLTPGVRKNIDRLENGNCVVLMAAHQPNFFAYSGVLRKATLNFVLARKLEAVLQLPVVSIFGIADQDFAADRWVRSCELPAVKRSGGRLVLEAKLPEKLMLNNVPKPSRELLLKWKHEVDKWLNESVMSITRMRKILDVDAFPLNLSSELNENLTSFWKIVEDCWKRSKNYSDFNGFLMSKIMNDVWEYDTVFGRFSECQQIFADDFSFLLSRFDDYSQLMKETMSKSLGDGASKGVSDQEPYLVPFWYHCHCGSKVKLFMTSKDGHLFGAGSCVRCKDYYELDFGHGENPDLAKIASRISARAIPMSLVFFRGLQPSCYVGGIGGSAYLAESEHVANGLGILFPPIVVWRPHDRYLGVGQAEALLELKLTNDYLGTQTFSAAKNLLSTQISKIRSQIHDLEVLKNDFAEKLKANPSDEEMKRNMKEISMERARLVKSSNLSVACRKLQILENALEALNLIPSIIDYAVNCGLKETSVQWMNYLTANGDFNSDVRIESALDFGEKLIKPVFDIPSRKICE